MNNVHLEFHDKANLEHRTSLICKSCAWGIFFFKKSCVLRERSIVQASLDFFKSQYECQHIINSSTYLCILLPLSSFYFFVHYEGQLCGRLAATLVSASYI